MKIRILEASGGNGVSARTSSILADRDILIDAAAGVGDFTFDKLRAIDHVFLTRLQLDQLAMLAFMADIVGANLRQPVPEHSLEATRPAPQAHLMSDQGTSAGREIALDQRRIRDVSVNHVMSAVGYLVRSTVGGAASSGASHCRG